MTKGTHAVLDIEEAVIDLEKKLREPLDPDPNVSRDLLGTLHVNLLSLARAGRKMAEQLALRHGFQPRPTKSWGPEVHAKVMESRNHEELLGHALDALHSIGGAYFARRALFGSTTEKPRYLTEPLKKSMQEKALTDEQIEAHSLEVWETVVIRLHELREKK